MPRTFQRRGLVVRDVVSSPSRFSDLASFSERISASWADIVMIGHRNTRYCVRIKQILDIANIPEGLEILACRLRPWNSQDPRHGLLVSAHFGQGRVSGKGVCNSRTRP